MRRNCGQYLTDTIIKITLKNETVLALTVVRIIIKAIGRSPLYEGFFMPARNSGQMMSI
jgi:hypothetical protein